MAHLVEATYDGSSLHLDEPLPIEPNTRVRVRVEPLATAGSIEPERRSCEPISFIETALALRMKRDEDEKPRADEADAVDVFKLALSMDLEGPPDWSSRIDYYLYGVERDEPEP